MAISVGSFSFPNLTAQPFGYQQTNTEAGLTARKWLISGLLTPADWLDLLDVYDTWRDTRILDEPSEVSGVVGTTFNFSGTGAGGETWTNIPCWFIAAPEGEQRGAYILTTVEIVDAAQALEVLLKEKEIQEETEDNVDLGTITIGTTVLTLLKPADAYQTNPSMELTATGVHYISGNLVPYKIKDIEGTTDLTGWNNIRTWYEKKISSNPVLNISSSTNASPISITVASAHGLSTGDTVIISGHTTNTNANGTWTVTSTGANTFTLNSSTGNGAGGATGTAKSLYFPISSPSASAANKVVAGVTTVEYTISIQLGVVI